MHGMLSAAIMLAGFAAAAAFGAGSSVWLCRAGTGQAEGFLQLAVFRRFRRRPHRAEPDDPAHGPYPPGPAEWHGPGEQVSIEEPPRPGPDQASLPSRPAAPALTAPGTLALPPGPGPDDSVESPGVTQSPVPAVPPQPADTAPAEGARVYVLGDPRRGR